MYLAIFRKCQKESYGNQVFACAKFEGTLFRLNFLFKQCKQRIINGASQKQT